jgi:hypothetical protein
MEELCTADVKVFAPVTTGINVSWKLMRCRPSDVHRSFGGIYCLYLRTKQLRITAPLIKDNYVRSEILTAVTKITVF